MHEHGSEERQKITDSIDKETTGNESPLHNESVTAAQFYEEKQDIQSDQGIGDQRNSSAGAIIITDWEHKFSLFSLVGTITDSRQGALIQAGKSTFE
jgi:hypothetical protein